MSHSHAHSHGCCSSKSTHSHSCCSSSSSSSLDVKKHVCCGRHKKKEFNLNELSTDELNIINMLKRYTYLPLARFILKSSKEKEFMSVSLAPVFLLSTHNTIEEINNTGHILKNLENLGYITLDYDILLDGYDYNEYLQSDAYKKFEETVFEAKNNTNFLGDTAKLDTGSFALSDDFLKTIDDSDTFMS